MTSGRSILVLCCISYFFHSTYAVPHFVVTSTESSNGKERGNDGASSKVLAVPEIYQMKVNSHITNRFVHNAVTSKVRNHAQKAQEAAFSLILTDNAFISGFVMEIDGKNYTAHVKDKEEAQRDYDRAVACGLSAAQVAATARDSNRFTVSVNLEPETKAAFYLTHEELLKRQDSRYELLINIHPGQPVKDLGVNVLISESKKLINVKAPPLRSGNEIGNEDDELDPRADIQIINDKEALISFSPSLERQKQLAHSMKTDNDDGLSAQFVVQYDVERDSTCGDVLIRDGYFVHFFAPSGLPILPKHVVFVLDTSGSMSGIKIEQLQDAMNKILKELHENDMFSLIEFSDNAKVWDLDSVSKSVWYPCFEYDDTCGDKDIATFQFPNAYPANAEYIEKAKNSVSQLTANGLTNIYDALKVAVHVADREARRNNDGSDRRPSIVFLTDGDASTGVTSTNQITNEITQMNSALRKSRLYCLSFGSRVDKKLLHDLSLRNDGFSKHIYEGLDVSIQLEGFYKQISSPVLNDVQFTYQPSVKGVSKTDYPVYYDGSEIIVAGSYDIDKPIIDMIVDCVAAKTPKIDKPVVEPTNSNLERLWAYLTIKQLLEPKENSDKDTDERKQKALDLALKYSFITPLTSLLVVKPTARGVVDIEDASNKIINRNCEETSSMSSSISVTEPSGYSSEAAPSNGAGSFIQSIMLNVVPTASLNLNRGNRGALASDVFMLLLPSGTYKLGLTETIPDHPPCTNTPLNGNGHCTLWYKCTQVHSLLTSLDVYENHFCVLRNEYAGLCCPNVKV